MDDTSYRRIRETERLLKENYALTKVCFVVIKNLGVEIAELRTEQAKLRSVVLTLLADPQAREDAEAVIRDYFINQPERKQ